LELNEKPFSTLYAVPRVKPCSEAERREEIEKMSAQHRFENSSSHTHDHHDHRSACNLTWLGSDVLANLWPPERVGMGRRVSSSLRMALIKAPHIHLHLSREVPYPENAKAWLESTHGCTLHLRISTVPCPQFWGMAAEPSIWPAHVSGILVDGTALRGRHVLKDGLHAFCNLVQLSLRGVTLGDSDVKALFSNGLRSTSRLTHLDLSDTGMSDTAVGHLVQALKRQTVALRHLALANNAFFAEGGRMLALDLITSSLESLDLSRSIDQVMQELKKQTYREREGRVFAEHIGLELLPRCTALRSLDLSCRYIGDEGANCVSVGIQCCTALTSLSLGGNVWDEAGVQAFASTLPYVTSLTTFRLTGKSVLPSIDGEPDSVSVGLSLCTQIRVLELSGVFAGCEGADHLFNALHKSTLLRSLSLTSGGLGTHSGGRLARLLSRCPYLTTLNLAGNSIDEVALQHLCTGLCSNLTALGLNDNALGDGGADLLVNVTKRLPLLQSVHVRGNGITLDGLRNMCRGLRERPLQRLSAEGNAYASLRASTRNKLQAELQHMMPGCRVFL
jgi:Ran GTPase-activating protein (RanGAP) involved in mRNA processing and transport